MSLLTTRARRQLNRLRKLPQWLRLTTLGSKGAISATSMDLCDDPHLGLLLGMQPRFHSRLRKDHAKTIVGWGRKWSGQRATRIAARDKKDCLLIEDGFLRSVGRDDPPLSIICDTQGVYYDASAANDLESHITTPLTATDEARTIALMALWRDQRVSKYNDQPEYQGNLPQDYVLVIDQVAGDHSISYGGAAGADFDRMLSAALEENPNAQVLLKVHPDQVNQAKCGHFNIATLQQNPRVQIIADACHPVRLIANARAVYTVTSQIGFEALIWGKPVHCFGNAFYSGWGLTNDRPQASQRRGTASLAQLVHSALIKYPRYLDPETQCPCEAEIVIRHIGLQRHIMATSPMRIQAVGFSPWKKRILQQFLPTTDIQFIRDGSAPSNDTKVAVWGQKATPPDGNQTPLRIEDGFLRSSGLGADLIRPLSWVFDDIGIYFDPRKPSRLENILQNKSFDAETVERAQNLIVAILNAGVSKYNTGRKTWHPPKTDKRRILVPGQVETDASVRAGCPNVKTNIGLLQAVRAQNEDAYIIYKPHPDVVAGLRRAGKQDDAAKQYCDLIVTDTDPAAMLAHVDEVHTLTSLMGFEALLRGIPVTCYGQPFYAGWGLTQDIIAVPRRRTRLTIAELAAGTLITYPRYISRVSGRPTTPERAITELTEWRRRGPSRPHFVRRILRSILRFWAQSGLKRSA
ncbi:capsular polysaccharide biosynthesis protein [Yoonia sp. BS5-3]|uniref:Capsular polysaccharide biosynthesis protein n=1 Tax=Yoonia phaeophyticola TaxID=3137369 RepID=A0ABZ2V4V0_9RHOB